MLNRKYDIFEDQKHGVFQVRSKSDVMVIEFDDEEKRTIFIDISTKINEDIDIQRLHKYLAKKQYDKDKILSVIDELKSFGILSEDLIKQEFSKSILDQISFWKSDNTTFDKSSPTEVQQKISDTQLVLIGNDFFLEIIGIKAKMSGFVKTTSVQLNDSLTDDKLFKIIKKSDILIVDSDKWNPYYLEKINEYAIELNKAWILVQGIAAMRATIGPLFIGKETGCYNCLMTRIRSNMEFLPYFDEFTEYLKTKKQSSKKEGAPAVVYDMMGSIAILEAMKYLVGWTIPAIYKAYLSIDLYSFDMKIHPFLKAPVCNVCNPTVDFNPAPWLEPITLT